jgi:hypothetical protein
MLGVGLTLYDMPITNIASLSPCGFDAQHAACTDQFDVLGLIRKKNRQAIGPQCMASLTSAPSPIHNSSGVLSSRSPITP